MNKTLLVTGASSDIGMALIENLNENYDYIIAHYNNWNSGLEKMKSKLGNKVYFFQADFSKENEVENFIVKIKENHLNPNHIVHLPATKIVAEKFLKIGWEEFDKGINISLKTAIKLTQEFLPEMKKNKYGKILFMLTSCTIDTPPKYQSAYTTIKYALLGLMKALAVEYADKGITVNGISPDMIETKFLKELPEIMIRQYEEKLPSKKILQVKDVVPTFRFLLSDGADNINGVNIAIKR